MDSAFETESMLRNRAQDDTNERVSYDEQKSVQSSRQRDGWSSILAKAGLCLMVGIIFGIAMEKSHVYEPVNIRGQMIFKKFVMLKMFVSAVAAGMFGMAIVAMVPFTQTKFLRTNHQYYNSLYDKGLVSSIIGGSVLGAGMTISGACPTMVMVQLATVTPNAIYTFGGLVLGTVLYGILKPLIDRVTRPMSRDSMNPFLESSYFVTALPMAAMFAVLVFSFEILLPWDLEIKVKSSSGWLLGKVWPPYVSGAVIGLLQMPLMVGLHETLGGSSAYCTAASQVFIGPLRKLAPFLSKYRFGFQSWWQVFYLVGVLYGAFLSTSWASIGAASQSGTRMRAVPAAHGLLGGALMALGARISGGCTSGHGLSGMGLLSILSFITVAAMFAGGIVTAHVMRGLGLLPLLQFVDGKPV